jgi:hypothetical protein
MKLGHFFFVLVPNVHIVALPYINTSHDEVTECLQSLRTAEYLLNGLREAEF